MKKAVAFCVLFAAGCANAPEARIEMCMTAQEQLRSCGCDPEARRLGSEPISLGEDQEIPRMVPRARWFALRALDGRIDADRIQLVCSSEQIPLRTVASGAEPSEVLVMVPAPAQGEPNIRECVLRYSIEYRDRRDRGKRTDREWTVNLVHRVEVARAEDRSGRLRWWPPTPGLERSPRWLEPTPPVPTAHPCPET